MRRALTSLLTLVVFAACAAFASAQERTHVRDVRVGAHPGFDRVVIELDGNAEIAWERGPAPGEESFYLDADLGRRERIVRTKLAQVGTVSLRAMRVGTQVSIEARERRVRAYLLASPTRLVVDFAAPGAEEFAAPKGVTPLAPATSIGTLKNAPVPPPPEPEPEPEPEAAVEPQHAEVPVTPEVSGEPVEGAVEAAPEPTPPEPEVTTHEPEVAAPEPAPEPTEPEVAAQEPEPGTAVTPEPAPAPEAAPEPESGFPWLLALGALAVAALVGALGFAVQRRSDEPQLVIRAPRTRPTPLGVEGISSDELRFAADATSVLEQRLDQEVRARVALEERLAEASEELKVLRDRVHRVERKRDEAH